MQVQGQDHIRSLLSTDRVDRCGNIIFSFFDRFEFACTNPIRDALDEILLSSIFCIVDSEYVLLFWLDFDQLVDESH